LIALPAYIDPDAWVGFEDMRRTIKKPLTDRARKLIVYELHRIKTAGFDPNAALDQSSLHCWADVYPPKEKPIQAAAPGVDAAAIELQRQREHKATKAPAEILARVKQAVRTV